jgi:hypothetical protein
MDASLILTRRASERALRRQPNTRNCGTRTARNTHASRP